MGQLVGLVRLQINFILWERIHNKKQELHTALCARLILSEPPQKNFFLQSPLKSFIILI